METHFLYIMISGTNTGVGKVIRKVTRFPYSHVSLTLRPELDKWVSFARYYKESTFVGGFIWEDIPRFSSMGTKMPVRIYRVSISQSEYDKLFAFFETAGTDNCALCYNLFDAVVTPLGKKCELPGCFTCLSFANAILGTKFRCISDLSDYLKNSLIYDGEYWDLKTWKEPISDLAYLKKISVSERLYSTASFVSSLIDRKKHPEVYQAKLPDIPCIHNYRVTIK